MLKIIFISLNLRLIIFVQSIPQNYVTLESYLYYSRCCFWSHWVHWSWRRRSATRQIYFRNVRIAPVGFLDGRYNTPEKRIIHLRKYECDRKLKTQKEEQLKSFFFFLLPSHHQIRL